MAALLAVGRIYDCMDLFQESIDLNPTQHSIRRRLYDMLWGTEDRPRAIPHGRLLVRHRQFDLSLLLSLSSTENLDGKR